jgi:hypothetical protein
MHRVSPKNRLWGILVALVCLSACGTSFQDIPGPICVAYLHNDDTRDIKWFSGKYMHVEPGYLELNGYVMNASPSEKPSNAMKGDHLPFGYYKVNLEVNGFGYYLVGNAIGNCVFIWKNSLPEEAYKTLR